MIFLSMGSEPDDRLDVQVSADARTRSMHALKSHYGSNIGNPIDIINRNRHFYRHGGGVHMSNKIVLRFYETRLPATPFGKLPSTLLRAGDRAKPEKPSL
jgi:hypothetical protein